MQTLYGIKVTDRVTVTYHPATDSYQAYFDGEKAGEPQPLGHMAVNAAIEFIQQQREMREETERLEAEAALMEQRREDDRELAHLADRIGVPVDELENFIEIIKKRIAE